MEPKTMKTFHLQPRYQALAFILLGGDPSTREIARQGTVTDETAEAAFRRLHELSRAPEFERAATTLFLAISLVAHSDPNTMAPQPPLAA